MKKLLLLSALMLTPLIAGAVNIYPHIDPCDKLPGCWFGEQTSFSGKQRVAPKIAYIPRLNTVYLEMSVNLGEKYDPYITTHCHRSIGTVMLLGTCKNGVLNFAKTTHTYWDAGSCEKTPHLEISKKFMGKIKGNTITLDGSFGTDWFGDLKYTLYKNALQTECANFAQKIAGIFPFPKEYTILSANAAGKIKD